MKKIPYGISDYKRFVQEGYYYIDKTKFIPKLEDMPPYLFFLRPRRFGKSLLISMLAHYYDIKYKSSFEALFADTYILNHKTKWANSYYILKLDFSAIDANNPRESLNEYCNIELQRFASDNAFEVNFKSQSCITNLTALLAYCSSANKPIYLLLDEYDNFMNKVLMADIKEYEGFVSRQEALFKQFFTVLKAGTAMENSPIKRMFITGVSPMALYDVTSGFNIGVNISNSPFFTELAGISDQELEEIVSYYGIQINYELIKKWYGNYSFNTRTDKTLYNTDMILYYLDHIVSLGVEPENLVDDNIRSDYGKLKFLVYTDRKLNGNLTTLQQVIYEGQVKVSKIVDNFSAFDLKDEGNFKSLLYYLGLCTVKPYGLILLLKLPNETVKRLMGEYIKGCLEHAEVFKLNLDEFNVKLNDFALNGSLSVFEYLAERLKASSGIREYVRGELFVKAFVLTYLSLSNYYVARSEHELNKGFADIFLEPLHPLVRYVGLIELKYIKREDFTEQRLSQSIQEAQTQLRVYEQDEMLNVYKEAGKEIKSVVIVFNGWEVVYVGQ